jgi:hypothetical protein
MDAAGTDVVRLDVAHLDAAGMMRQRVRRLGFAVTALSMAQGSWASETCHYAGTTSYAGHVTVETKAAAANGETTVDVAARINATSLGFIHWQYLYQEIGTWRDNELQSVGVNHRYSVGGSIRRQQWDLFNRTPDGMAAYRVQANTLDDFKTRHPGFAPHWDTASFGEPWLPDYAKAAAERRADLDLPRASTSSGLGTPLLMAFFWVRWAGQKERTVPLFLPGFKHDARVDIQVQPIGVEANGLLHLRSSVRYKALSETQVSTGDAWISPDHRLARVTFDARTDHASAQGDLRLEGCQGDPPAP